MNAGMGFAHHLEHRVSALMARSGVTITRVALGIIFLWFGILKFLPTITPIDVLAERTLAMITFHQFTAEHCLHVLAVWECMIGLGLLSGRLLRFTLILLFLQLPGTFLPLVLLAHETWVKFPVPTFEGQYIIKNIALIAAGIVVGSTVRGGRIIANPEIAEKAARVERAVEEKLSAIAAQEELPERLPLPERQHEARHFAN
jgi:uncharacterized membrane protein YkgB